MGRLREKFHTVKMMHLIPHNRNINVVFITRLLILTTVVFLFSCTQKPKESVGKPKDNTNHETPIPNTIEAVKSGAYNNMVFFQGGVYKIGNDLGLPNEFPSHDVTLKSFYIDRSPVTVGEFRRFIKSAGYRTEAEKFGDAGVFDLLKMQWELRKGAIWEYPLGNNEKAGDDHPVTQVSWNDALAYAQWAGKRLPTEAEWEVAARSGEYSSQKFSWGDHLVVYGRFMANVWQGEISNTKTEDGYLYTSPVGVFGENKAGLTDMGGNVWNWCSDIYTAYPGSKIAVQHDETVRVIRGGSFFFGENGENSFTVSCRGFNSSETSLFNIGFRCAVNAE